MLVGIVFDKYTSQVENAITRDLITLQNSDDITVSNSDPALDRVLQPLGIQRLPFEGVADVWLAYQTGPDALDVPSQPDAEVITRVLYQQPSGANIDPGVHTGPYLPKPGWPTRSTIFTMRPPRGKPPTTPWLALLFSSRINSGAGVEEVE